MFLDFGFLLSLKAFCQIGAFLRLNDLSRAPEPWRPIPFHLRLKPSYFLALIRFRSLQALVTSVQIFCYQKSVEKTLDFYICGAEKAIATCSEQCALTGFSEQNHVQATVTWKGSTFLFPAPVKQGCACQEYNILLLLLFYSLCCETLSSQSNIKPEVL